MLGKKMQDALNAQLKNELSAAYTYFGMSAYCEEKNLPGFARWLKEQAREEMMHALRFYQFILDRDGHVVLQALDAPRSDYKSMIDVFQTALEHERMVTASIHALNRLADDERDYGAHSLLADFAAEQVEEEKNTGAIVDSLKLIGDSGPGLFLLDRELGQRQAEGSEEST